MRARPPLVLFVAAAGPRRGFGHLVRAGVLADALGVARQLVLRGSQPTLHAALGLGWTVHQGRHVLAHLQPDLVVVDDPSAAHTARWVRLARQQHIPVASVHDGHSSKADADLIIDGSVTARADSRRHRLAGPSFSILRPRATTRRVPQSHRQTPRVLVALGGGAHVRRKGVAIATAIASAIPTARVDLAAGFSFVGAWPALPARCRWITARDGLSAHLASAHVAVVAGGVTLYESCALGTPTVAVPVVPAQHPAIRVAISAGAVVGVGTRHERHAPADIAAAVAAVLTTPMLAVGLSRRARRLVDGHGTARVVARLRALMDSPRSGRWRHAA